MILTWLIFLPVLGGALAWILGRGRSAARGIALGACILDFALILFALRKMSAGGFSNITPLEQHLPWIPSLGISYYLVLDGISLLLVMLTALLGIIAVAASWREISNRPGAFYFSLLAVLSGVTGVFLARDLLLFYFFWELMLVPMYFLIGLWGHERRVYASIKFFLFTFISSLLMLAAILALAFIHQKQTMTLTFNAQELLNTALSPSAGLWIMLGFFAAFAVKLPVVPVHTWLAEAHTEAPTGGSIVLAGLLLKTGAYGMLRFAVPLFPEAAVSFAPIACALGVIGIIYGALLSFAQTDLKRMVAFSSISHMGFVLLGIYSGNEIALQGAMLQMLAHGIATPALFLWPAVFKKDAGRGELGRLGGLWQTAPRLGGFTLFFALAALGLPGLGNFIGEFLTLLGAYLVHPALGIIGSLGFVLSVIYALRLVQETMHGPNRAEWSIFDLTARELGALGVLAAVIIWMGLFPSWIFKNRARLYPDA